MGFVSQGCEPQRPACEDAVFEVHREIPDQLQQGARKVRVWWGALLAIAVIFSAACAFAQQGASSQAAPPSEPTQSSTPSRANPETPASQQQPQRILGIMPNFRAVSPGETPPPPTPKEGFKIATQNSFDYSAFIFVGLTSLVAQGANLHPQLGKGVGGYGQYYWRGFVDKTNGNYLVDFALPVVFHQDTRYYAIGKGGFWERTMYAASRVFITPDYQGHGSVNYSELLGRGIAQGISVTYYPVQDRTAGAVVSRYAWAVGRDALTNVFREFWPDIATGALHRHP